MNELGVMHNLNLVIIKKKKKKYETMLRVRVTKRNKRLAWLDSYENQLYRINTFKIQLGCVNERKIINQFSGNIKWELFL